MADVPAKQGQWDIVTARPRRRLLSGALLLMLALSTVGAREDDMASGEYFRRQADVCLQLAQVTSEDAIAARLPKMAEVFHIKALELDAAPSIVPQGWASGRMRGTY